MLDARLKTFLTLCELKSYTKTAQRLFITQPAVTQHIQFLEKQYGARLFCYNGKQLTLTPKGELLHWYVLTQAADERKICSLLREPDPQSHRVNFGVTLSIGEFVMPQILAQYLAKYPAHQISMATENTQTLLHKLKEGKIDFAILEGRFNKSKYGHTLLSREPFEAVCSPSFPLPARISSLDELTDYPVIVREQGSGTRDILENILHGYNLSLRDFRRVYEIGNFQTIKHLVGQGCGITFAYHPVVREELERKSLRKIEIEGLALEREFNFVYLKESIFKQEHLAFHRFCTEIYSAQTGFSKKADEYV